MPRNSETILVVDDEQSDLRSARAALENVGFKVVTADQFALALQLFTMQREEIDAAVVDVSLPGRNGCELAIELLKQKPDLKVLFVSGHVGAEVIRFYGLPASDIHFLQKPFMPRDLTERLEKVLASPEPVGWLNQLDPGTRPKLGKDS